MMHAQATQPISDDEWLIYLVNLPDSQKQKALAMLDEGQISALKSLDIIKETQEIGEQTLDELLKQSHQLDRMQGKINQIECDQIKSKRSIRSIRSIFGQIFNDCFGACFGHQEPEPVVSSAGSIPTLNIFEETAPPPPMTPLFDKYKKIDQTLDQINLISQNLEQIASSMSHELNTQNKRIDKLLDSVDDAIKRSEKLRQEAKECLN